MPGGSIDFGRFQQITNAQTAKEVDRTARRLQAGWEATRADAVHSVQTHDAQGQQVPLLPARLTTENPEQLRRIQELPQLAQKFGYKVPEVTPEVEKWVDQRRKDARFVDRERWIAQRFDLTDPTKAAWLRSILPSFLERRKQYGEVKMGMQKQLFDIVLYGPQSEEDIDFMFAIDSGQIDLDELRRPVWEAPQPTTKAQYVAGMFAKAPKNLRGAYRVNMQGWDQTMPIASGLGPEYMDDASRWPGSEYNFVSGESGNLAGGERLKI